MRIISYGKTDVGRKRPGNEDCFGVFDGIGLYVVADGMGGHAAGEVASRTAVETLRGFIEATDGLAGISWPVPVDAGRDISENRLAAGIELANRQILTLSKGSPELRGMGTTVVSALYAQGFLYVAHVGDSRAYLYKGGRLSRITTDHSYVEELVSMGRITAEEARSHPMRNIITRALGTKEGVAVDPARHGFAPGDACLLCSDGLTGMITDAEIAEVLSENPDNVSDAVERLIQRANGAGGNDNITAVLIKLA